MDASTVYTIAKALPDKERAKLYDMLKAEQKPKTITKIRRKKTQIDFTVDDATEYLISNYFNKIKTT